MNAKQLATEALKCLVIWRCVKCRHDLYEMPPHSTGPCPTCGTVSHMHGIFCDDRDELLRLLTEAVKEQL